MEYNEHITGKVNIRLEDIIINKLKEKYRGKTIRELEIRNRTGANIIGFKSSDGEYIINPSPDTIMKPDSKLFVLGTSEEVEELTKVLF